MGKLRRLLTWLILPTAFISLVSAIAMADGGLPTASTGWALTWLTPYVPILIPALSGIQSVIVRGQTLQDGFWHGYWGHMLLVLFGALIGAGLDFLQAGAFTKTELLAALAGAATAFFGAWKTTGKESKDDEGATTSTKGTIGALIFIPLLFATVSGCASGADGLRQACTAADTVLAGAYKTTAAVYHQRKETLKAQIPTAGPVGVKQAWDLAHEIVDKALASLDAASDTKAALCALIPAVEAGQRKDVNDLIAKVTQVGADVAAVVADIKKLTSALARRFV
jgi:hypothetical protein